MIQRLTINPNQIRTYSELTLNADGPLNGFPLLSIDEDSYIVSAEIQSGINFRAEEGCHCLSIGKFCSLADGITFMIDLNHNYGAVCQGEAAFLNGVNIPDVARRKGSIILQNDVWVGHGATIMGGVTLHNGCVVASGAVVTKDVPPYAIVGGNPAKIIRYRFTETIINGLQKIAYWDWPQELRNARKQDFALPPPEFVAKYLPEAEEKLSSISLIPRESKRAVVLFIPDITEKFPLYPKVFHQFFAQDRQDVELLIYISRIESRERNIRVIERELEKYEDRDCYVTLQTGMDINEHALLEYADYFVTTRAKETVRRTSLCNLHHAKILYGTDDLLFTV